MTSAENMPAPDTGPAVRIDGLSFAWPTSPTLLDIDRFEIGAGEKVMLHGPSGSGKSTLLGLVTGVLGGASGKCEVLGLDMVTANGPSRDRLRADGIGYIFQSFNLVPYLSVIDNVLLPCRLSDKRRERAGTAPRTTASTLLDRLGLEGPKLQRGPVTALSVGQQQRVAAARALIGAPSLIIADEPTSSLDHDRRDTFLSLLLGEAEQAGSAVLFVSHDLSLTDRFERAVALDEINRATTKTETA